MTMDTTGMPGAPYTSVIVDNAGNEYINGQLPPGNYCVSVSNADGCVTGADCFVIGSPGPLDVDVAIVHESCVNDVLIPGSIELENLAGGTPPYTYSWSDGIPAGGNVTDLPIGDITVIVTDNNGCTGTATATIGAPDALDLQMSQVDALCKGEANGSASVVVTGGTQPYTYQWSNGQTSQIATNLSVGTYSVTVTSDEGCTSICSVTLTEPNPCNNILDPGSICCDQMLWQYFLSH